MGKTVSPYSQRSVLELNCAFLDQARVVLEQHQLDCTLEPGAGGSAHAWWVNHSRGVLGSAGPGSPEPLPGLELSELGPARPIQRGLAALCSQG